MPAFSPLIPLSLGTAAFALFLFFLISAAVITMRNRRIISRQNKK